MVFLQSLDCQKTQHAKNAKRKSKTEGKNYFFVCRERSQTFYSCKENNPHPKAYKEGENWYFHM